MLPTSMGLLDKRVRQRIAQLETTVARCASVSAQLIDNAQLVHDEVRACFAHQQQCLRAREQQLLTQLDTMVAVKSDILRDQREQLQEALDMCKESADAPCAQLERVLRAAAAVGVHPCESPLINFEADTMPLRRLLHSFGTLVNARPMKTCESLPAELEDYEDEETSSNMLLQSKTFTDGGYGQRRTADERLLIRLAAAPVGTYGHQADTNAIRQWLSHMRMDSEDHEPNVYNKSLLPRSATDDSFAQFYARLAAEPMDAWLAPRPTGEHRAQQHIMSTETTGMPFEEVVRMVLKSDDSMWLARNTDAAAMTTERQPAVRYDMNTWLSRASIADNDRRASLATSAGGAADGHGRYDLHQWLLKKL